MPQQASQPNSPESLETLRHSTAHLMAQAVQELFPGTHLTIGPAIEEGFYYDFDSSHKFLPEDLPVIEKKMKELAKKKIPIVKKEMSREEYAKLMESKGEKFKLELLADIPANEKATIYQQDWFIDLCRGPHVPDTSYLKIFKLLSVAGAYWRGDEHNPMLQRIYGTAFFSQEELDSHLKMLEEAKLRDHRKLGKEMEIYFFDDEVGPGLPLWLPNGAIMMEELEKLAKETEFKAGYVRVRTPHLTKESLFLKSGHLPYYAESMYPPMEMDGYRYYIKPMNCPMHHKIFSSRLRSYRELPLRLAEYGTCYRYEKSGELFGLMRVRSMQMNDAHIYCPEELFEQEFMAVIEMYRYYFKLFGIDKYVMRLSTHHKDGLGKKYVDNERLWLHTEDLVRRAMKNGKVPFQEVPDEAAFYGPKIDVQIWSAIGKEFTLATNQVDFAQPSRFGLNFINRTGKEETPLCIHRAPLSTHERMVGFLLEHYAGAFPVWLAPVQARVLPITDSQLAYAKKVCETLKDGGIRAEVDERNEKLGGKIRTAQMEKIPYMLVVGDKEMQSGQVAVRTRKSEDLGPMPLAGFLQKIQKEIAEKA